WSHISTVVSSTVARVMIPAELTSTSSRPKLPATRAVDQHVQPAEAPGHARREVPGGGGIGEIGLEDLPAHPELLQGVHGDLGLTAGAMAVDPNGHPAPAQSQRDGPAQPVPRARHQRDAGPELHQMAPLVTGRMW